MESEQQTAAEGAEARPPFPLEEERPPTPRSEPVLTPRKRGGLGITSQLVRARPGREREAERVVDGFVEAIFFRTAERIEAMEAEREATLMRERAAEAALRRIRDPIVVHDETPPTSNAEDKALDSASMEDSRRAEDEL